MRDAMLQPRSKTVASKQDEQIPESGGDMATSVATPEEHSQEPTAEGSPRTPTSEPLKVTSGMRIMEVHQMRRLPVLTPVTEDEDSSSGATNPIRTPVTDDEDDNERAFLRSLDFRRSDGGPLF